MIRTIEDIRNIETGEELSSDKLLSNSNEYIFRLRRKLAECRNTDNHFLVCAICNQPVTIAGNKMQVFFFKHLRDSDICPIKTSCNLTQKEINCLKYQGAKESKKHKDLKKHISTMLLMDTNFSDVKEEKVIKSLDTQSSSWRKPDISSKYKEKMVVFEIQLSTTYLNVIIDRENFYKNENIYILWFFNLSSPNKYRFTEKDILYSNKNNAFIIDNETIKKSKNNKELLVISDFGEGFDIQP